MKRIVSLLFVCLLCVTLTVPCFAEEFVNPPIVDGAQYLDEAQLEKLSEKIEGIRQKYNFEVAIVTEDEMSGYDAMSSADDIYDYNGYGAGENDDGILLYICAETREYWITTHADGLRVFNERGIDYLKKNIEEQLVNDNYYLAMDVFADLADELLEMAANGEPYNKKQLSCFAAEFENPPIIDEACYLTEDEFIELSEKIEAIRQRHDFDVAIVTEDEMSGYDVISTADDIYDYLYYGAGENCDGVMFYICSAESEFHLTAHGKGISYFNENGLDYINREVTPHLKNGDYYRAMDTFANLSEELIEMGEAGNPYDKKPLDIRYILIVVGCAVLIPLIIAWIMMKAKLSKMKTAVENDYAENYMKPGSMNIAVSRDMFLYSRVIKTPRPKSNSGSGSGSHTSSSGRTHTGSSGSF